MHPNQTNSPWTPALKRRLFSLLSTSPNLTYKEIASRLGLTIGQVAGAAHRAQYSENTLFTRLSALELNFERVKQETELPRERKFLLQNSEPLKLLLKLFNIRS